MKKVVLVAASVAAFDFGYAASAADMPVTAPVAVPYHWAGLHVGVNGGYGWSPSTGSLSANSADFALAIAAGGTPQSFQTKASGAIGGAQLGYSWQRDMFVWGIETDIDAAGISQTSTVLFTAAGGILSSTSTGI